MYQTIINGVTTGFLYDGDALVLEYTTSNMVAKRYVHGDQVDEPWVQYNTASTAAANLNFLHADHQGSIIALSNSTVVSVTSNAYDAFGIAGANNQGRFGYTGQLLFKELGLNHYKARFYSPILGRFLQTDPIGYKDQMNLYAYVGNDPVNMVDPTGMETEIERAKKEITKKPLDGDINKKSGKTADGRFDKDGKLGYRSGNRPHKGIDIKGSKGDKVVAAGKGTIKNSCQW